MKAALLKFVSLSLVLMMFGTAEVGCESSAPTSLPATEEQGSEQTSPSDTTMQAEDTFFVGVTDLPADETPEPTNPKDTVTPDLPTDEPSVTLTPDVTPDSTPTPDTAPMPDDTVDHANNRDVYKDAPYILKETEDGGLDYQGRVVFLGDSTTYGLKHYGVLEEGTKSDQVWYGPNGTIALFNIKTVKVSCEAFSSSMRVGEALEKYPPDILVITLGVNGVSSLKEDGFKEYYGWLIKTVFEKSPKTKIIAQSIYPISSFYKYQNTLNNKKITIANGWIRDLVSEYYNKGKAIYYLDTYNKLLDKHGEYMNLDYKNSASDGIHLNKKGHNVVLRNLRTHMIP